jgi:hypothetical protein
MTLTTGLHVAPVPASGDGGANRRGRVSFPDAGAAFGPITSQPHPDR